MAETKTKILSIDDEQGIRDLLSFELKLLWYGTTQYYAENELFPGSPGGILPKV